MRYFFEKNWRNIRRAQLFFVSLYSQSGYKCNDVFASKMTGQDAESARASLRIALAS